MFNSKKVYFNLVLGDRPVDISLKLIFLDIMLKNQFLCSHFSNFSSIYLNLEPALRYN